MSATIGNDCAHTNASSTTCLPAELHTKYRKRMLCPPAASATTTSRCQREPHPLNRIKVDLDRTLGTIDRNVFGGFVEHLGRCVYGGIYDPGSPLADATGCARTSEAAIDRLRLANIRYPGGNFVSGYRWRDGVGPVEDRPRRAELAWASGRAEHLRDQRVHRLLPDARRGALPRRQLRRRRPARGARLGRVLQRHHRHGPGPAARAARLSRAAPGPLLGHRQRGRRCLADRRQDRRPSTPGPTTSSPRSCAGRTRRSS